MLDANDRKTLEKYLADLKEAERIADVIRMTWQGVPPLYPTREEWLNEMASRILSLAYLKGYNFSGKYRVSCGFPRGKRNVIGQCWSYSCSKDRTTEIFISPTIDDPIDCVAVLVHELVHFIVGNKAGHGIVFKRCAVSMGLIGKMTSTYPSPLLMVWIADRFNQLGNYPHASLSDFSEIKKQGTRLIKLACPNCGYIIRTTHKCLERGVPTCPCGEEFKPS